MANASLQAFRRTVTVDWPAQQQKDAKAHLLRVARDGHAKIMSEQVTRGGIRPDFEAYANRPGNSNLDAVALPGPIVFRYYYLREIIRTALDELRKRSPAVSGAYRAGHTLFVNGIAMEDVPATLRPTDDIMISNPVPYARRIEIGRTKSGRDFVLQVPNRIYERVAKQVLHPRYRNTAKITFTYANLPNAHTIKGGLSSHYGTAAKLVGTSFTTSRQRKRRQQVGSTVQAPAIVIEAFK